MMKYLLILTMAAVNTGLMAADIPVHINAANKWIIVEKAKWNSPSIDVLIRENSGAVLIHESIGQTTKYNLKMYLMVNISSEVENDQKDKNSDHVFYMMASYRAKRSLRSTSQTLR
ncbi:MAG: hypothetical protein IPP42_04680 [Saprospiraceae bacterium]|nr:hypothetical protein [Saprospiraceae bacterium]